MNLAKVIGIEKKECPEYLSIGADGYAKGYNACVSEFEKFEMDALALAKLMYQNDGSHTHWDISTEISKEIYLYNAQEIISKSSEWIKKGIS